MQTLSLAITLFFVLDPFGNLPIVLTLLARVDERRRRTIVVREAIFALMALALFYVGGPAFLKLLDVGPADLKICGGFVLGIIALRMVFPDEQAGLVKEATGEPFIVPLAIPLMAGPSSLATVIIMSAQSAGNPLEGLTMITLAWFGMFVILLLGVILGRYIPVRLLAALERLTGLLLSVIAVRMLMTGLQTYLVVRPA